MSLLTFVLYPVFFERRPQDRAAWIADQLRAAATAGTRSLFRRLVPGELEVIVREIKAELAQPTLQVSAIPMPSKPSESDLRECLALVVGRLEATDGD